MALSVYVKKAWDYVSFAVNPANLNHIEQGIKDVTDEVILHEDDSSHVAGDLYNYKNNGGGL